MERLVGGRIRAFDDPARRPPEGRRPSGPRCWRRALTGQVRLPADDLVDLAPTGDRSRCRRPTCADAIARDPRPRCSVRHRPAGACARSCERWPAGSSPLVAARTRPSRAPSTPRCAPAPTSKPRSGGSGRRISGPALVQAAAVESRGPRPCRRRACSTPTSSAACSAAAAASSTTNRGRRPSSSSSTRPKRWSTASPGSTATSWSTRRRTSRRWSCERVARRCPSRSMTVLGDLAQATAPGAQSSWEEAVVHLGSPPGAQIEELELGYRVPAPVLDVANRLLPHGRPRGAAVPVGPRAGPSPGVHRRGARASSARRWPAWSPTRPSRWASVGVIAPDPHLATVRKALDEVGRRRRRRPARRSRARRVAARAGAGQGPRVRRGGGRVARRLHDGSPTVGDDGGGGRLLYVALTRAVQELTVVSPDDLPHRPSSAPERLPNVPPCSCGTEGS